MVSNKTILGFAESKYETVFLHCRRSKVVTSLQGFYVFHKM